MSDDPAPASAPPAAPRPRPAQAARPCPLCGQPAHSDYRPFCSRGCRDRDLIAWFGEDYRLPVRPAAEEGDEPEAPHRDPD